MDIRDLWLETNIHLIEPVGARVEIISRFGGRWMIARPEDWQRCLKAANWSAEARERIEQARLRWWAS